MKNWIQKKGVSDYLILGSLVLTLLGLIMYFCTGITAFNESYNIPCIIFLIVCMVLDALGFVFSFKAFKYLSFILGLYAFIEYIFSQINYITNVFVSIDGTSFSFGFIVNILSILIGVILSLVAGILAKNDVNDLFKKKEEKPQ